MNILHAIKGKNVGRKVSWIGDYLLRNCLPKHIVEGNIEGRIEVNRRRGRRRKQLLDDLKGRRGYCKLKEKTLDRTLWRTSFRSVYGPILRQTTECTNIG
jgi:hypothetical protein